MEQLNQKSNVHITEEQWLYIQKEVVEPLWKYSFRSMYEDVRLDYDDFISLCAWELDKAIKTFDASKSNLKTFATNVIKRKAITQIRDMKREKRKALTYSVSMDAPYGDSDLELKDIISDVVADENTLNQDDYDEGITNVCDYLKEISGMQKNILICKLLEFENSDICTAFNISSVKFNDLMKNMRRFEKAKYLRRVSDQ